jgi:hypothetical protein
MTDTTPVAITIRADSALAEHLNSGLSRLRTALAPVQPDVKVSESEEDDLAALDPATIHFFLEIGKVAGNAVIALVAKEVCVWLWNEIGARLGPGAPKTVGLVIGGKTIEVPSSPSPADQERLIEACEGALRSATGQVSQNPP